MLSSDPSQMRLLNRVKVELERLELDPPPGVSVWPIDPDHPLKLTSRIVGPPATPFEEGEFEVEIDLPLRYPFEPPKLRFVSPIYHPNIDSAGRICLSTLTMPPKGSWTPSLNISTVMTSPRSLLAEPNVQDPLVMEICEVYKSNPDEFDRRARDWSRRLAPPNLSLPTVPSTLPTGSVDHTLRVLPLSTKEEREAEAEEEFEEEAEEEFENEAEEEFEEEFEEPRHLKRTRHD